jgi:hypothetical protein
MTDYEKRFEEEKAAFERDIARALETSGLERSELKRRVSRANWTENALRNHLAENPDWLAVLDADVIAADAERETKRDETIRGSVRYVFRAGPVAMAIMPAAARLACIPKQFRWVAEKYDPAEHGGLAVIGATGTGKTMSVVHAVDRLLTAFFSNNVREMRHGSQHGERYDIAFSVQEGSPYSWFRAVDIGKARKQAPLGDGEVEIVTKAVDAQVTIIDDLGWEDERDTAIAEIVAERYDAQRPTIITSGLTAEQIAARYSAAFLRRIIDGSPKGRIVNAFPKAAPLAAVK